MKKLVQYESGHAYIWTDSLMIQEHGGKITTEQDLSDATHDEIEKLKKNPHDTQLLQEIAKRPKLK